MSTFTNQRCTIQLIVDPNLVGKLIGKSGSNIRRITSTVRAGCYIRANGDTFTISAWTQRAVQKASEMIQLDQASLQDPSKRPSKPFAVFEMDPIVVPHIIGRNGIGLRSIMNRVGDGCFIIHREGAFHISANSESDLAFVKKLLNQYKNNFTQLFVGTNNNQNDSLVNNQIDGSDNDVLVNISDVKHFPEMNTPDHSSNVSMSITPCSGSTELYSSPDLDCAHHCTSYGNSQGEWVDV